MRLSTGSAGWDCDACGRGDSVAVSPSERLAERRENCASAERIRLDQEKRAARHNSAEREYLRWTLKRF